MHQSFALAGDIIAFQWPWHPPPPPCEAPHTALSLEVASTVHWHCAYSSDDCSSDSLQERGRTVSVKSSVSSKCCNTVQQTKAVMMKMFMWLTYSWSWDLAGILPSKVDGNRQLRGDLVSLSPHWLSKLSLPLLIAFLSSLPHYLYHVSCPNKLLILSKLLYFSICTPIPVVQTLKSA